MGRKKSKASKMSTNGELAQEVTHDDDLSNGVPIKSEPIEDAKSLRTSSLEDLQTKDSRRVMDIVDRLRRSGLSGEVQLPQLVVCGDQSSGKSSVLEAITEIPFPRKESLCTRFATEIILRRAPKGSISTKIIPDKVRPAAEKQKLETFKRSIQDFSELPKLIDEATKLMGLDDDNNTGAARAFSRDVLSIDIAGPGRPQLTLVDLPGLIHTETKAQSKADVELIRGLVQDYMEEKRTIILAVVSAKNDYANQIILKNCREVDPKGRRTLGIITKPDTLKPGSANELEWIDLAKNSDVYLELGWHLLKNRSEEEINSSFIERNSAESTFFATGRYRDLPQEMVGIIALRTRLSHLLYKHLKTELPALQKELNDKHSDVCHQIGLLGESRATTSEQRRFLMAISTSYQEIVNAAVKGHYDHPFFETLNPDEPIDSETNMSRLRAVIQHFNTQYADLMRQYGQKSKVQGKDASNEPPSTSAKIDGEYGQFASLQESVTREAAVDRVKNILIRSRGRELPLTFSPDLISQLFWDQSENWKAITQYHVDRVAVTCAEFANRVIDYVVSSDVSKRLTGLKIDGALDSRQAKAQSELEMIIQDTKRHPITYDPQYYETVHERREKRLQELAEAANQPANSAFELFALKKSRGPDMEKFAAEEALDDSLAYYEKEVNFFIEVVVKQVVERHLLTNLAAETISPMIIGEMDDDEVAFIAAEPEEVTHERTALQARKATLEQGQQTFKSALGLFR